jgi:hypothetical protein
MRANNSPLVKIKMNNAQQTEETISAQININDHEMIALRYLENPRRYPQDPRLNLFDTEIALPLPPSGLRAALNMFSCRAHATTHTTTLRQHFLNTINELNNVIATNPTQDNLCFKNMFLSNVHNALTSRGNPARFFTRIFPETSAICDAVYKQSQVIPVETATEEQSIPSPLHL